MVGNVLLLLQIHHLPFLVAQVGEDGAGIPVAIANADAALGVYVGMHSRRTIRMFILLLSRSLHVIMAQPFMWLTQ